ncbi:hypothetical protein HNR62_000292 [Oceanisphaera litoralis]|uniref:hypothetical protein n=1 Tax=Oceanisphaera litoralis TaxID=225144 RepID=UPI00195CAF55|nr:hypothetical protein [Oceanisphaera litoralis]MBM7454463.1 hypothetical protein [Oceanisphaera litoralis]
MKQLLNPLAQLGGLPPVVGGAGGSPDIMNALSGTLFGKAFGGITPPIFQLLGLMGGKAEGKGEVEDEDEEGTPTNKRRRKATSATETAAAEANHRFDLGKYPKG